MANQIEKVNTIDITSIEKINLLDDDDIEKLNLLEFTGIVDFTWSTGGAVYDSGRTAFGAAGTQTAALSVGGYGGGYESDCGEYNGTAWTQSGVGSLSGANALMGCGGSQTSGITVGGSDGTSEHAYDASELYNGSTWSSSTAPNIEHATAFGGGGAGTSNDDFTFAGCDTYDPPSAGGTPSAQTENWNGSAWTTLDSMDNATHYCMTFGAADDCFCIGGYGYPYQHNYVQQYNGTSWSVNGETLGSHSRQQGGGFGTTSSALVVAGAGKEDSGDAWGSLVSSEQWDGSTWASEDNYPGGAGANCQGTGYRASGTGGGLMWGGSGDIDYTGEYG